MEWQCYLLYSDTRKRTYIGITNDLSRRINQHNGIIVGGAKATRIASDWRYLHTCSFNSKSDALRFEYAWKQQCGVNKRLAYVGINPIV